MAQQAAGKTWEGSASCRDPIETGWSWVMLSWSRACLALYPHKGCMRNDKIEFGHARAVVVCLSLQLWCFCDAACKGTGEVRMARKRHFTIITMIKTIITMII